MAQYFAVGIGASAGGYEALLPLLKNLPKNGRFVYIIAQHMHSYAHSDLMVKLLSSICALPVCIASSITPLEVDHVYLIPAGFDGYVEDAKIYLIPPVDSSYVKPSINVLFNSLATEFQSRAVGIILSGVGSDGAKGCEAIKKYGGVAIAQLPADARFSSMPLAAIKTGGVEIVDSPEIIASKLADLKLASVAEIKSGSTLLDISEQQMHALTKMVLSETGVDFNQYKTETLKRRLNARMTFLRLNSVNQYIQHCAQHPEEIKNLQQIFLVSTSKIFRDYSAFKALRSEILQLLKNKSLALPIQVFVPACASGEECYSLAALFNDAFEELDVHPDLIIQGCDLNQTALQKAHAGWYPLKSFKETPFHILQKYFEKHGEGFRAVNQLRQCCKFMQADIFNIGFDYKFDLISCRNLLIYLDTDLQNTLIKHFFEMLKPQGILFIGQAENLTEQASRYFVTLSHTYKIYRKR